MTHPIGPQRATPASPAKIHAEVGQARRAMADSLKVGDFITTNDAKTTKHCMELLSTLDVILAQRFILRGTHVKLQTKGGE